MRREKSRIFGKCVDPAKVFESPHLDPLCSPRHGRLMTRGPVSPHIAENYAQRADDAIFRLIRLMAKQAAGEFCGVAHGVEDPQPNVPNQPEEN